MKLISSYTELLAKHASAGDPAAFHSLFRNQVRQLYIAQTNSGESHEKSCDTVISFITRSYVRFVKSRGAASPEDWFSKQTQQFTGKMQALPGDEIALEKINLTSIDDFEHRVLMALEREYGKLKTVSGGKHLLTQQVMSKPARNILFIAAICVTFFVILSGTEIFLHLTNSRIDVIITLPGYKISFSLPSNSIKRNSESLSQPHDQQHDTPVKDTITDNNMVLKTDSGKSIIPDTSNKSVMPPKPLRRIARKKPVFENKIFDADSNTIFPDDTAVSPAHN